MSDFQMSKYLKVFIFVGSLVLFTGVFRLINSARVNLDNKNTCVQNRVKFYLENKYTTEESKAFGYQDCK